MPDEQEARIGVMVGGELLEAPHTEVPGLNFRAFLYGLGGDELVGYDVCGLCCAQIGT